MNLNRFKFAIFALIFSSVIQLFAQQPLGLVVGDLITPYSVFMNPANVASNYSKRVYVNWWGTSLEAQSSFANSWKHESSSLHMDQSWMPKSENQNWSLNYLNETYGPSMFFMADNKVGFGLGIKGVSGFNFQGVNPDLGNILRYGRSEWAITELNGEVDAGRKSLDECQKLMEDKALAIKDLQDKLNAKTSEVNSLQSQLKSAQAQLNDAKARLAKCEEEKASMNNGPGSLPSGKGNSGGTTPGGNVPLGGGN